MLICSLSVKYLWFSFMKRVIFQSNIRGELYVGSVKGIHLHRVFVRYCMTQSALFMYMT